MHHRVVIADILGKKIQVDFNASPCAGGGGIVSQRAQKNDRTELRLHVPLIYPQFPAYEHCILAIVICSHIRVLSLRS